jgi:hypothetical protein
MQEWLSAGPLRPMVDALRDPQARIWDFVDRDQATSVLGSEASQRWSTAWSFGVLNAWLISL